MQKLLTSEMELEEMIRIMIVDDHSIVRRGLRLIIESEPNMEVLVEAKTASEAIDECKNHTLDVILLDVSLGDESGISIIGELKAIQKGVQILILTMHPEEQYALMALKAGASGYLTKNFDTATLLEAIKTVANGEKYVSPEIQNLFRLSKDGDQLPPHQQLTTREYTVFIHLVNGVSNGKIAELMCISPKTVTTYRNRILSRMELPDNAALLRYALDNNLIQ